MSWLSSLGRKVFGGDKKTTTTTALDPASQKYVDAMRQQAQAGANTIMAGPYQMPGGGGMMGGPGGAQGGGSWFTGPQTMSIGDQAAAFMNPYQQQVIDATRGEFDHLRNQANLAANQQATQAGAFGGSRHGIMAGARLGEIDRGQASTISGLLASGYQNALSQGTAYADYQRQLAQQQLQEPIFRAQTAQGLYTGGMGPYGQTTTQTQSGEGLLPGLLRTGMGAFNIYQGMQQPQGYQSGPSYTMPQPWQAPQWNPQYRGPYG